MTDLYIPVLRRRFLEDMRIKGLLPKTQTMYLRAMRELRISSAPMVLPIAATMQAT
ncbi:hypothetical protein [Ruegeria jejuensis]|uniref:hypothetical protein n=1 Tax=Ruegeria jejuensis TaxID=3233338 RepID=UPI00355B5A3A